jgi:hypothetical protein
MLEWLVPADLEIPYVGAGWPFATPAQHVFDDESRSFEDRLDTT